MPDDLELHPSEGRDGNASNVVFAGIRPVFSGGFARTVYVRGTGGTVFPCHVNDEYIAKLEAALFMTVERARLATADEAELLNKLLDEYEVEMERAGEISTEEEIQVAWVAESDGLVLPLEADFGRHPNALPRPYLAFSASALWSTISGLPRYMVITP
jgi:hypothetical protein